MLLPVFPGGCSFEQGGQLQGTGRKARRRSARTAKRLIRTVSYTPTLFWKHFTFPVVGALVLAVTGFALLFSWSVTTQNRQARETATMMVRTGLDLHREKLARNTRIQGYWDEAYENTVVRFNVNWLAGSWGAWTADAGMSFIFLLNPENESLYAVRDGVVAPAEPDLHLSLAYRDVVAAARQAPNGKVVTDTLLFDGQPALVAATRVTPEKQGEATAENQHVLLIGRRIDERLLAELAATYHLSSLSFEAPDEGVAEHEYCDLEIVSNAGSMIGRIYWPAASPGNDLPTLFWPLVAGLLIGLTLLTWFILRNSRAIVQLVSASEARALRMAQRDGLTGLVNRARFRSMLGQMHARMQPNDPPIGVLFLDMDGFKPVNDKFGHSAGDDLLRQVARILKRETKGLALAARLGGDEFAILIHGRPQPETSEVISRRIHAALLKPQPAAGALVQVGVSIGIAFLGQEDADAADVLRRADIAMYEAKKVRGGTRFYSPEMEELDRRRRGQVAAFRAALEGGTLELLYQPQVSLRDGRVMAVEAQLHWSLPGHLPQSPRDLMALAEESGTFERVSLWMLEEACANARDWPEVAVAVNIAAVQLRQPDFARCVEEVLTRTGLSAAKLELELPEIAFHGRCPETRRTLTALSALGVRLVLDGFGTERASLAALRNSQFIKIKLDPSLLPHASWSDNARALLSALGTLGRSLGVPVVADGVETESNAVMVMACGCALGQGFYFSGPLTAAQVTSLSRDGERLALPSNRWVVA